MKKDKIKDDENMNSDSDETPKKKKVKINKKSKVEKEKAASKKILDYDSDKNISLSFINYTNYNPITRDDLKSGRRIFNNKTKLNPYDNNDPEFNKNFIDFHQLFYEDLLLSDDLKDDFNISTVRTKTRASSALFSTFIYDGEFIESLVNGFKMPSIIIRHEENQKYNAMDEHGNYIKFVFPKISQALKWGKFHSKLILLKFPTFLRIIVPSANLTECDWYYWGQIIWFQDFPLIKKNEKKEKEEKDIKRSKDFRDYLKQFMKTFMPHTYDGKKFWTDLNINFEEYDFSDACVDLVASANGRFIGDEEKDLFGLGRLNSLMSNKYFSLSKNDNILIQCSSLGVSKQKTFFSNLYKGFNLNNYNNLYDTNNVDLFYPTEIYIYSSDKRKELCTCLFFNNEAYKLYKDKLHDIALKDKFRDRETVFHSKIFITGKRNNKGNFILNNDSIIYIGSHNLSLSAWGNYEKNESQIAIANYELGVLFDCNVLSYEEKLDIYNNILFNFDNPKYSKEDKPFIIENII